MVRYLQLTFSLCFLFLSSCLFAEDNGYCSGIRTNMDNNVICVLDSISYKLQHKTNLNIQDYFITSEEFENLKEKFYPNYTNCLTNEEMDFDANYAINEFNQIINSNLDIRNIEPISFKVMSSCGNVFDIIVIKCNIQLNGEIAEIPFLLTEVSPQKFKILKSLLIYNLLKNEK